MTANTIACRCQSSCTGVWSASLTNRPVERLLAQTLNSGLPPLPAPPVTMGEALLELEALSDGELQ